MLIANLTIDTIDTGNGFKKAVADYTTRSVGDFTYTGSQESSIKMLPEKEVSISDLVQSLDEISVLFIGSKNDDYNVVSLFDVSVVDTDGNVLSSQRTSMYCMMGVKDMTHNIVINNMQNNGTNPTLQIFIATK